MKRARQGTFSKASHLGYMMPPLSILTVCIGETLKVVYPGVFHASSLWLIPSASVGRDSAQDRKAVMARVIKKRASKALFSHYTV